MNNTGVIILAAGRGERFGSDKREALIGDTPMLLHTVQQYAPLATPILVVASPTLSAGLRQQVQQWAEVIVLPERAHPDQAAGMGDSLALGVQQAHSNGWDAALIALGDMPWVRHGTLNQINRALQTNRAVVPVFNGRWGHPVGFQRDHFAAFESLRGERGGRAILTGIAPREIPVTDPGVILDVDTPDQLNLHH